MRHTDSKSPVWLTGFWGFSPKEEGILGFTDQRDRARLIGQIGERQLVCIYGAASPETDSKLVHHLLGVLEIERTTIDSWDKMADNAVTDWEGVGDADGNVIPVSPEAIDALLDVWPLFETFQTDYVAKGLVLDQEKNVLPPLPTGSSAGVGTTARPAHPARAAGTPARTARKKSTRRKQ